MKSDLEASIEAYLDRADTSLKAARDLLGFGYCEIAVSRAYYAAFYAASAALLHKDLIASRHSAVIALVHQHLVKSGMLEVNLGRLLDWLFELRSMADYDVAEPVSRQNAERAVAAADELVRALATLAR